MALPSISDAVSVRSLDDFKELFNSVKCVIDDLPVDVLNSSTVTHDYTITERPVEYGFNLNDSRSPSQITLSLECIFTNAIENLSPSGMIKQLISTGKVNFDSWKKKRDHLLKLKDKNKVISVKTPDKTYKNMMIKNIGAIRNTTYDAFYFTIDFVEVTIKQTMTTTASNLDPPPENAVKDEKIEKRKAPKKTIPQKTAPPTPFNERLPVGIE